MDTLVRLFLRFLIVPIGVLAAVVVATLVATFANWQAFLALVAADPAAPALDPATFAFGVVLVAMQSLAVIVMLFPGALGILLAESFAIRSWMFHAPMGGLSIWIGWTVMADFRRDYAFYDDPKIVIAAGIAGGFAYWAVAGFSAGFWKPVFGPDPPPVRSAGADLPPGRDLL